jgi:hypothetical protein
MYIISSDTIYQDTNIILDTDESLAIKPLVSYGYFTSPKSIINVNYDGTININNL